MVSVMNERILIAGLLAHVRAAGTQAHHLALKSTTEHLGVCVGRYRYTGGHPVPHGAGFQQVDQQLVGTCTLPCQIWQQVIADAERYLAETAVTEVPEVQQGAFWGDEHE